MIYCEVPAKKGCGWIVHAGQFCAYKSSFLALRNQDTLMEEFKTWQSTGFVYYKVCL